MAYQYKVGGKVVTLAVDPALVAMRFREPAPAAVRATHAMRLGIGPFEGRIEVPGEKYTIFAPMTPPAAAPVAAARALAADDDVARVAPVFRVGNRHVLATDRVVVGFAAGVSEEEATRFLTRRGYTVLDTFGNSPKAKSTSKIAIVTRLPETEDPFEVAEKLTNLKQIDYAEPDFVTVGTHTPRSGGRAPMAGGLGTRAGSVGPAAAGADPLLARQYAMAITKAKDAWAIASAASPDTKIAILDEGVDRAHEDLRVTAEFDATGNDLDQQPNDWDGHGTACAGLAAARPNNDLGVRGVAGGAQVLAVRIAFSNFNGGPWVTSNTIIARAIDWAWENGADVLSNSWGGGAPSNLISEAFERARTLGRNGLGCPVVVAAGNDNMLIGFPADLPNLLVVTASNEFDEPKTPTSGDGEFWWGSSFGPQAGIAAPGVHNYTTDISGDAGYSVGGTLDGTVYGPSYTPDFNGTSSATPIVAGAAALLLHVNPSLTEAQVREHLTASADKVGGTYAAGHNQRMGFGRLNVLGAVNRVMTSGGTTVAKLTRPAGDVKVTKASTT